MIVALHGFLLIFRRGILETLSIYPGHGEKLYFSKVRTFLRPEPFLPFAPIDYALSLAFVACHT